MIVRKTLLVIIARMSTLVILPLTMLLEMMWYMLILVTGNFLVVIILKLPLTRDVII